MTQKKSKLYKFMKVFAAISFVLALAFAGLLVGYRLELDHEIFKWAQENNQYFNQLVLFYFVAALKAENLELKGQA